MYKVISVIVIYQLHIILYCKSCPIYFRGVCHAHNYLILVCKILEPTSKIARKLFLPNHNLLHNTSNKGKVLPYTTTITPYWYETHIILSRPFLSLLLPWLLPFCAFLLLLVRFGGFSRDNYLTYLFFCFIFPRYAYFPRKSVVGVLYCIVHTCFSK